MTIKKDHFSISKQSQYPPFFRVIQTIYSPLLGNVSPHDSPDRSPYTALLTLGLWRDESKKYGVSICSLLNSKISDPNWQPMNDYEFSRLTGEVNRLFADHCDIAHPPVCDPVELKTLHEESLRPGPTMQVPRETLISVFTSMQAAMKAMGEPEFLLPLHGAKTLQDARCDLAYHVGRLAYWLQVKVP